MDKINIEVEVINWLNTKLGVAWPVSGDKPKDNQAQYVLVDRTGGPREAMVLDQAEILIEVYHKTSRLTASDKAQEIGDAITELLLVENITRAKVNSIVKLDDNIAQYYRYQIYCDVFGRR